MPNFHEILDQIGRPRADLLVRGPRFSVGDYVRQMELGGRKSVSSTLPCAGLGSLPSAPPQQTLTKHVFPYAGQSNAARIADADLLAVLRRIESQGTFELTHRLRSIGPRAVNRQALAINTVARRIVDWVDAARFVLLGFLYEGRGSAG